ncbi:MAG: ComF family protein [Gammaproteobacteria bacterium]|nr:ComF family protein [Gammaproteobacteria bacterium]
MWQRLLDKIYPQHCLLCHASSQNISLCQGCQNELPSNHNACWHCAQPLEGAAQHSALICAHCLKKPLTIDRCIVPFRYHSPIDFMVKQLKFQQKLVYAPLIAELMLFSLKQETDLPQLILPVPLHSARLQQRGFNQSQEIALHLAKLLNLTCRYDLLTRRINTRSQTELTAKLRQKNIKGAFQVRKTIPAKRIALIDDVMTSGSTANELAKTVKQAGVEEVQLWAFARAGAPLRQS